MRKAGKSGGEKTPVDRLRAFQRSSPANKRCADCVELGPTYICLDFRTFVCQYCSGIHREFGHKIKGISLSQWAPAEVEDLERGGNDVAAEVWLARWKKEDGAEPGGGDIERVRTFLRQKYKEKRWWQERPVEAKKIEAPVSSENPKSSEVEVLAQAPPALPPQDLLGFSSDVPASTPSLLASPPVATSTSSLFELEPIVATATTGSLISIPPPAPTTSSLFELDATTQNEARPLQSPPIATNDAQWTADFSSTQTVADLQPQKGGLFDIDFSGNTAPSQDNALFGVDLFGSTDSQGSTCSSFAQTSSELTLQASAPIAGSADSGESAGERLRQALLNGSGTELNRLFEQSRQPALDQPTTSAERFAALQGNLGNLFSSSQQSFGSATSTFCPMGPTMMHSATPSLSNQLALPPAPSASAPSSSCTWQQESWWQNCGQSTNFAPQQTLGWQNSMPSSILPVPSSAPSTFTPPVGAPTSTPFPQMPSFTQHGLMQGAMASTFNAPPQISNMSAHSHLSVGPATTALKPSVLDEPLVQSPPKESQFGDLLAAFTEKHPIDGLSIMA